MNSEKKSATIKKFNIKEYMPMIETVVKVEIKKFNVPHLIEYSELINIGIQVVHTLAKTSNIEAFNSSYLSTAIKWAIRNEVRRRYKWYLLRNQEQTGPQYTPMVSIDDAEGDYPIVLKDESASPEYNAQLSEIRKCIEKAIAELPEKEREIVKAKFFYNKKLKDISQEFNLSQSRISRIIQFSLEKIKKDLIKQECQ